MQRLTYQNVLGETVAFFHKPFIFCKVRGVGMSDIDVKTISGAYQQGESVTTLRREGRRVKLTLHLMANTRQELYQLRSELLEKLSPERAFDGVNRARLIYENDYGRRWTWAVPESGLDWGDRKQNVHPMLILNFRCESPFWYSMGRNETDFRRRGDGLILPMKLPLQLGSKRFEVTATNNGQTDTPVEVVIEGSGEKPSLVNERTGAVIALVSALPAREILRVNTDPAELAVTLTHEDGSVESGFGMLDPCASVAEFVLKPGENRLRYISDGESSHTVIRVSWYDRFEGV